ncbi:hypothetical protein MMC07_006492 [Pseudocyphellaria aurata]|nr:hypothetical protein [Pseudocyphellaria aurata]
MPTRNTIEMIGGLQEAIASLTDEVVGIRDTAGFEEAIVSLREKVAALLDAVAAINDKLSGASDYIPERYWAEAGMYITWYEEASATEDFTPELLEEHSSKRVPLSGYPPLQKEKIKELGNASFVP